MSLEPAIPAELPHGLELNARSVTEQDINQRMVNFARNALRKVKNTIKILDR
jgi:hypothetical protein